VNTEIYGECVHRPDNDEYAEPCTDCEMTQQGLKDAESDLLVEQAFTLSLDEFTKLKVAERDTIIFAMLRQQAAGMQVLQMKIAEYEQKARDLMSPESMETVKAKVFEAFGFGGSGNGMFGGMFS
jgi:hypothetical protein